MNHRDRGSYINKRFRNLLPQEILSKLSGSASRLYGMAWNGMAREDKSVVVLTDLKVKEKLGIDEDGLSFVHKELQDAGLLDIRRDTNPRWCDGEPRSQYRYKAWQTAIEAVA